MEMNIKKVCAPTDFSEAADAAVNYAAGLAREFGAELHLIHVIHDISEKLRHPDFTNADTSVHQFLGKLEKGATEYLANLAVDKESKGLTVYRSHLLGSTVEEICKYAAQNHIDLLVIGTHGHTGLKHLLLGSVAERVVRLAPCPVLTFRRKD